MTLAATPPEPGLSDMVTAMLVMVERFNSEIIGLPIPDAPQLLSPERLEYSVGHLKEELEELEEAHADGDVEKAADAIIDFVYVALGRLVEMGIAPMPIFQEVHRANMEKKRGEVSKRPNSMGYDAVKPEGWVSPSLGPYLVPKADLERALGIMQSRMVNVLQTKTPIGSNSSETLIDRVKRTRKPVALMPDGSAPELSSVLAKVTALRAKKGEDYNVGPVIEDYFPFGHKSYVHMIHLKSLRLQSLLAVIDTGKEPNFEGLEDTVLDLINYATFYGERLEKGDL